MKKRILAVFMTVVMAFGFVLPMHGLGVTYEPEVAGVTSFVEVDGFVFEITESVDELHRITRTFERSFVPLSADVNEARMLLIAMGMSEDMLDMIPKEDLEVIATSPRIFGTVSYVEETSNGISRYVTAEYALAQADYINTFFDAPLMPLSPPGEYQNSYIRVIHIVSTVANSNRRQLLHTTGAEWLSMPFFRHYGSLGVATQLSSPLQGTGSGYFRFDHIHNHANPVRVTGTLPVTMLGSGSSALAGVRFTLPSDTVAHWHRNFAVTMSHRTEFSMPTLPTVISSNATYTHRTIGFGTPSLGLSGSGTSFGIGFSASYNHYHAHLNFRP